MVSSDNGSLNGRNIIFASDICLPDSSLKTSLGFNEGVLLANLEGPIVRSIDDFENRPKAGPHLYSSERNFREFFSTNLVLNLANNHMMDFGQEALFETMETLNVNGIHFVGAGLTESLAKQPFILLLEESEVAIIACCEHQFGIARFAQPGVAGYGAWVETQIRKQVVLGRKVIVSYHRAQEMFPWPTIEMQARCRCWIELGATVVHCHHSHVPRGYETWGSGMIIYGGGNFVVEPGSWISNPNSNWSILFQVDIFSEKLEFEIKTTVLESNGDHVYLRESTRSEFQKHIDWIELANRPLESETDLIAINQEVATYLYDSLFKYWLNRDVNLKSIIREPIRWVKKMMAGTMQEDLLIYHLFACESHREVIQQAIGLLNGELTDYRNQRSSQLLKTVLHA